MIAVIADDFTGAAEIAGIALRFGLHVNVYLSTTGLDKSDPSADGVIICTDSRSMTKDEAIRTTSAAVKEILKRKSLFVYKKIDSVLRGWVLEELQVQMQMEAKKKAIILPANPSLGRTISDGEYFIDGKKITETGFVNDPEFPVTSSFIKDMLHNDAVEVRKHTEVLPDQGFVVGEASSVDDTDAWIDAINKDWILTGAGDFFTALLKKMYRQKAQPEIEIREPFLFVSGTAFSEKKELVKQLKSHRGCVSYLPEIENEDWLAETGCIIQQQGKLVIAINESNSDAVSLRVSMAKAVKQIVERENVKEIFIEGGSTAAAILAELNIKMLQPVNELSRGVVRMKADDLFITVKPGSYSLPEIVTTILNR